MHSPDVDVIVAFVNPVTIVPMDEHLLFSTIVLGRASIRSAKQDDIYGASNILLPCPGS